MTFDPAKPNPRRERVCEMCGEAFIPLSGGGAKTQKYCSIACRGAAWTSSATSEYPPEDELRSLYCDQGLSDRAIAKHYGRPYNWIFAARKHYGIRSRRRGPKPSQNADIHRKNWHIRLKGETACRACGVSALDLHHIVPRSKSRAGRLAVEANGMPLCRRCHVGWHRNCLVIPVSCLTPTEYAFAVEHAGVVWVEKRYPGTPSAEQAYAVELVGLEEARRYVTNEREAA